MVGNELTEEGAPLVLVEDAEGRVLAAREAGIEVIVGNAATRNALTLANVMGARCVVIAIPNAFEAGQAVEQCRKLNAGIRIIARAHSDEEVDYLRRLGADEVIMGEREIGLGMIDWLNGQDKASRRDADAKAVRFAERENLLQQARVSLPVPAEDAETIALMDLEPITPQLDPPAPPPAPPIVAPPVDVRRIEPILPPVAPTPSAAPVLAGRSTPIIPMPAPRPLIPEPAVPAMESAPFVMPEPAAAAPPVVEPAEPVPAIEPPQAMAMAAPVEPSQAVEMSASPVEPSAGEPTSAFAAEPEPAAVVAEPASPPSLADVIAELVAPDGVVVVPDMTEGFVPWQEPPAAAPEEEPSVPSAELQREAYFVQPALAPYPPDADSLDEPPPAPAAEPIEAAEDAGMPVMDRPAPMRRPLEEPPLLTETEPPAEAQARPGVRVVPASEIVILPPELGEGTPAGSEPLPFRSQFWDELEEEGMAADIFTERRRPTPPLHDVRDLHASRTAAEQGDWFEALERDLFGGEAVEPGTQPRPEEPPPTPQPIETPTPQEEPQRPEQPIETPHPVEEPQPPAQPLETPVPIEIPSSPLPPAGPVAVDEGNGEPDGDVDALGRREPRIY